MLPTIPGTNALGMQRTSRNVQGKRSLVDNPNRHFSLSGGQKYSARFQQGVTQSPISAVSPWSPTTPGGIKSPFVTDALSPEKVPLNLSQGAKAS
jgi:hypothetical protein